jgi:hypothetical protein
MGANTKAGELHATIVLAVVVSIAAMMLTVGLTAAAASRATPMPIRTSAGGGAQANLPLGQYPAAGHVYVVKPNGHDDTADLQAAFNACVSSGGPCTVQLVKGTYYTSQITVFGFQGIFAGMGQGVTKILALPNLPDPGAAYNTPLSPFWAGMPGAANPWPDLFTFVNGAFGISGMTITEPYANPLVAPGWQYPAAYGDTTFTALYAVIFVTGESANAAISHVTVNGGAGGIAIPAGTPSTFNLEGSIVYQGMLLPSGWTDPFLDQIPLSGAFSLTNSVLYWAESAFYIENLLSASVTVCYNSVSSSPAPEFVDVSNSQLTFCGNSITNVAVYTGLGGIQSDLKSNLLPSTVYVVGNYFEANWDGSGPSLFDYGPAFWGVPSTLSAVVTGNVIVTDNSCGCYSPAVSESLITFQLASTVFSGNVLTGGGAAIAVNNEFGGPVTVVGNLVMGADIGIALYYSNGVEVTKNVVLNSVTYGIAVLLGSSNALVSHNLVIGSGAYDLYWDQTGTGDLWYGNIYGTSSPAVLP